MIPILDKLDDDYGFNPAIFLAFLGSFILVFILFFVDVPLGRWLGILFSVSPLWLPYILFHLFHEEWMGFVRLEFVEKQGRVTLEIKFPQEVSKSPLAMELFLTQLYQIASPDNLIETYWDGKHPPIFGLEMVSDGGVVHFYISAPVKKYKNIVESQLYAQYPGIVITELKTDYTHAVPWDPKKWGYFSMHLRLKKASPYPIKTYIDFGLDKDPKEEFKVDPITPVLELLGSLNPGERIWIQFLISGHTKKNFQRGSLSAHDDWTHEVQEEIDRLAQRDHHKQGAVEFESAPRVTPGERDTISALERHMGKYAFDTKLRVLYAAPFEAYIPGDRIGAMLTLWRAFDDINRNQIGMGWRTDYNWNWWQDPSGKKREYHRKRELKEYKLRMYNNQSKIDRGFIMTTEELATLFHPAGAVVLTPSLERIPSARSEPPANLPRGIGI